MRYEVGSTKCGAFKWVMFMIQSTFLTWRYCRKHGYTCNEWFGVYGEGDDLIYASTGPMPGSEERARLICHAMNCDRPK